MSRLKEVGIVLAMLLALSGFAVAYEKDDYHGGSIEARQHGYEHGYRDGFHHGREDHERRATYNFRTEDHGYRDSYGNKDTYKQDYRNGFLRGYQDGFGRRR